MATAMDSVNEAGMAINVCAQIRDLPAGGLGTDLVVTLSTVDGTKAGLQRTTDAVDNITNILMTLCTYIHTLLVLRFSSLWFCSML